jgi:hypothetical protein
MQNHQLLNDNIFFAWLAVFPMHSSIFFIYYIMVPTGENSRPGRGTTIKAEILRKFRQLDFSDIKLLRCLI